ncbi:MAG: lycopene cyclase domain-containing protein [Flavicella sp.]
MTPIYLYTLLASLIVPMLFSIFCIDFIKKWKYFSISTLLVASVFLIWDVIFTDLRVWGFNHDYCLDAYFLGLPLEEWLFFTIIPFCSLFTHFSIFYAWPKLRLGRKTTLYISILLLLTVTVVLFFNFGKAYTTVNYSFVLITLAIGLLYDPTLLQQFYISFLVILVPFFIVNGILTGAITPNPIVWYDNTENLGIRIHTIPVEDIGYAFSMLFSNLMIFNKLKNNKMKS